MAGSSPVSRGLRVVRDIQASLGAGSAGPVTASPIQAQSAEPFDQSTAPMPEAPSESAPPAEHGALPAVTAFISWAHAHSSWTPDRISEWESQVATLAAVLCRLGIDTEVDLFHLDEAEDWTRFGPKHVQSARHTLIVMSESWAERWSGTNRPTEGAGAAAEADTLRGLFASNQAEWQRRVVIVMLPGVPSSTVPPDLQRVARVSVDPTEVDTYEDLIRFLTGQPKYPKPNVGSVPRYGVASVYEESALAGLQSRLDAIERRQRTLKSRHSPAADSERERLRMTESATRGFIDAELAMDND